MPGITQQAKKQIGQLAKQTFETVKDQPRDVALRALEQMGVKSGSSQSGGQNKPTARPGEKSNLQQLKEIDKVKSNRQIMRLKNDLQSEIEKWRQIREEQLRRRREQAEPAASPEQPSSPLTAPGGKPKRGSLFLRRQKTKTEGAASKRSG